LAGFSQLVFVPELIMITQVAGVETEAHPLGRALEPCRVHQGAVLPLEFLHLRELLDGMDLGRVVPVFEAGGQSIAKADAGDERFVQVPDWRHSEVG